MASGIDRLAQQIAGLLKKDSPSGYDTTATVTRIEGGTAWVHIPGGVEETPVRMTVNAKAGDSVQVRVSGGRAFIIGNGTAPPTDDTRANCAALAANRAQAAADKAEEDAIYAAKRAAEANERAQAAQDVATATSQHFWTDDGGVHVSSEASNATATRNTLWNSLGMLFRKGANILLAITTGATPSIDFYDGEGNAGSNIIASFGSAGVRIGTANATQIVLDSTNGLKLGTKVSISPSGAAKFDGEVQSTSGKIGGWDITSSSLKGEHNNKGTGFQIPSSGTWAIAVGYDTTLGTGWVSAPFRVNHSGKMWATDAEIQGKVTATSGKIGEFTLSNGTLSNTVGNYTITLRNVQTGHPEYGVFYITDSSATDQHPFRVNGDGSIKATKGTIAGWNIDSNSIYYGTKSSGTSASDVTLMSSSTFTRTIANISRSSLKFAIGSKFGVNSSGVLYAGEFYCNGNIGVGKKTSSSDGESGAWLTAGGQIHLEAGASSGGSLAFHYNHSASATSSIHESQSGIITVTGKLDADLEGNTSCSGVITAKVASGHTDRTLVGSQSDDGQRVGMIRCTSTSQAGIASQNGTAGSSYAWRNFSVSSSDIRLKKNVEDCEVEDALSVINRIKMHSFDWLHTDEHQRIGFIADELEEIDPKLAMGGGKEKDGTINYKSVDTFYMMGYLVKAVQELSTEVERLRRELNGNHSES